jgi:hypothetical protein
MLEIGLGVAMSMDPVVLSAITAAQPHEAQYDAVYAAVTATERGRWFLTEFTQRNRAADTDVVVAAIARIEAAIRGDAMPQSSAPLWRDLSGLAAAVERIRTAIADETPPDVAGAVERIQDISFSLRERVVDVVLCDALDAAAQEISVACAPKRANGKSAGSAAELLADLARRVDELIKPSVGGEASRETASQTLDPVPDLLATQAPVEAPYHDETLSRIDLFARELEESKELPEAVVMLATSLTDAASALGPRGDDAGPVMPRLDDVSPAETSESLLANGVARWHIESPDFLFRPVESGPEKEAESFTVSGHNHALLPETELQSSPEDDPADIFEAEVEAPAPASAADFKAPAESPPPQIRIVNTPVVRSIVRPVSSDPLARLRGLSEDELNALFG